MVMMTWEFRCDADDCKAVQEVPVEYGIGVSPDPWIRWLPTGWICTYDLVLCPKHRIGPKKEDPPKDDQPG